MTRLLQFNPSYFAWTVLLFITEVLIALYVHDQIVRPYIGDVLVVMLIYCFIRSFFKLPVLKTATAVLIFSFLIETLQYFNFVAVLGLQHSAFANTVMGNSFAWIDVLCYIAGFALVLLAERFYFKKATAAG